MWVQLAVSTENHSGHIPFSVRQTANIIYVAISEAILTSVTLRCTKRENIWSEKGYLSETTLSPQKRAKSLLDTVSPTFHNGNLVERRGTTIPTATPTELSVFCLGYILSLYM